jgi:hypothetical protein
MSDFRATPEDADLFDRIRDEIVGDPAGYREAGAWLDGRYSRDGIVEARSPVVPRASDALGTPEDPRNEPVWRLNCCVVDLLAEAEAGELDLTVLGDYERLRLARRIIYVTWLITDPEAGTRGVGTSSVETARWAEYEDGALGRAWTRRIAFREPDVWRALVTVAWAAVERDRRRRRDEKAIALADPPTHAGTRESYLEFLESSPRTCYKACLGFLDAALQVMGEHLSGAVEELDQPGAKADWPPGTTARSRVQKLVKVKMPGLLHEALVLAPTDALRRTIDLRLQRILDLAEDLARVLDGMSANALMNIDRRSMRRGPWLEPYDRLQTAVFQTWPLTNTVLAAEHQRDSLPAPGNVPAPGGGIDGQALAQTVAAILEAKLGPADVGGPRLIRANIAARKYHVSTSALRMAVREGRLKDRRPEGAAANSPLLLDEDEVARLWPLRNASLAR